MQWIVILTTCFKFIPKTSFAYIQTVLNISIILLFNSRGFLRFEPNEDILHEPRIDFIKMKLNFLPYAVYMHTTVWIK